MPFYAKTIFANEWLFTGIILNIYKGTSSGNSLVRTTMAPTIINAGIKDNVIPTKAEEILNFRILPGEKIYDVYSQKNYKKYTRLAVRVRLLQFVRKYSVQYFYNA